MSEKFEVIRSANGGCVVCCNCDEDLYVVREEGSESLSAVCSCCLLRDLDRYRIDNTRPWPIEGEEGAEGCEK